LSVNQGFALRLSPKGRSYGQPHKLKRTRAPTGERVKVLTPDKACNRGRAFRARRAGRLPTQTLASFTPAQADSLPQALQRRFRPLVSHAFKKLDAHPSDRLLGKNA